MNREVLYDLTNLLILPSRFYKKKMGLKGAVYIVLLFGIVTAIGTGSLNFVTLTAVGESKLVITIGSLSPAFIAFLEVFFIWFLLSGLFFTISHFLGGNGDFKILLSNVGYGFLPMILGSIIGLIIGIATWGKISTVMELGEAFYNPAITFSNIQGLLFLLWSANIWVFGVSSARDMTPKRALITVTMPVSAIIIYQAYWLFQFGVFGSWF